MAQLVIPNSVTAKLFFSGPTRNWCYCFGGTASGEVVVTQAMADALYTNVRASAQLTNLLALMSPSTAFISATLRNIHRANQPEFTGTGVPLPGTGTGDMLPLSVSQVVTLRTALSGRSFRGRIYFTGFTEAQNDTGGRAVTAVGTTCDAFIGSLSALFTQQGYPMSVLSRPRDAVTIPARTIAGKSGTGTPVTAHQVRNTKWESQRRRTGKT